METRLQAGKEGVEVESRSVPSTLLRLSFSSFTREIKQRRGEGVFFSPRARRDENDADKRFFSSSFASLWLFARARLIAKNLLQNEVCYLALKVDELALAEVQGSPA